MIRILLLSCGVCAAAATASASGQTIRGSGAHPCPQWLQARQDGGHDYAAEQWALGYISGVNATSSGHSQNLFLAGGDNALFGRIDAFCSAHGKALVWDAVSALIRQTNPS